MKPLDAFISIILFVLSMVAFAIIAQTFGCVTPQQKTPAKSWEVHQ